MEDLVILAQPPILRLQPLGLGQLLGGIPVAVATVDLCLDDQAAHRLLSDGHLLGDSR